MKTNAKIVSPEYQKNEEEGKNQQKKKTIVLSLECVEIKYFNLLIKDPL
jgi:hypothetical protein